MSRYRAVPGTRLEAIGAMWAAFSPASGETHVLNAESAAIVEWLNEHGDGVTADVAHDLAAEVGLPPDRVAAAVELSWGPLRAAGLVRLDDGPGSG